MDYAARRKANNNLLRGLVMRELHAGVVSLEVRNHIDHLLRWEAEDQEDFLQALEETVYTPTASAPEEDTSRYSLATLAGEVERTAEIIGMVASAAPLTLTEAQEEAFAQGVAEFEARQAEREAEIPERPAFLVEAETLVDPKANGYTISEPEPVPAGEPDLIHRPEAEDFWMRYDVIKALECAQVIVQKEGFEAALRWVVNDGFEEREARRIVIRAQRINQSEEKAKFTVEVLATHNLKPLGAIRGEAAEESEPEEAAADPEPDIVQGASAALPGNEDWKKHPWSHLRNGDEAYGPYCGVRLQAGRKGLVPGTPEWIAFVRAGMEKKGFPNAERG